MNKAIAVMSGLGMGCSRGEPVSMGEPPNANVSQRHLTHPVRNLAQPVIPGERKFDEKSVGNFGLIVA